MPGARSDPRTRKAAALHLPIAIGATAGVYAASLAGVALLQSQADAALAARGKPLADAVARVSESRAAAELDLQSTAAALNSASAAYRSAAEKSAAVEALVAALSREITSVTGAESAIRLPAAGLPAAPGTMSVAAAPPVVATTGASGKP